MTLHIGLITLLPEMADALRYGIVGRAQERGLLTLHCQNPRAFTHDVHHTVVDRPYGGGPGMVMKCEPLYATIQSLKATLGTTTPVIHVSPQGRPFTHADAKRLSLQPALILLCSRYEGVDERLVQQVVDEECSVGDFVVSGGELPAFLIIDAITRLLPGALGTAESAVHDSFATGLLEHPHYTRPACFQGLSVPPVLLSGDHEAIARFRLKQSLGRTWQRRQDLLKRHILTELESQLLAEFIQETEESS